MSIFLEKITSRKFLAALAGLVTGLAMVFGLDETIISTVAGAVVAVGSVATYIITEGRIDKAALSNAVTLTEEAIKVLEDGTETLNTEALK